MWEIAKLKKAICGLATYIKVELTLLFMLPSMPPVTLIYSYNIARKPIPVSFDSSTQALRIRPKHRYLSACNK